MDTENTLSADIRAAGEKARYDAACKAVLSTKIILAWILKYCVEEFKSYEVDDIVNCIEGEPRVSAVGVMPNTTNTEKINGITNEDSSINEGTIFYDIIFNVVLPTKERIELIINVEAQNEMNPGYPIKVRMVYYGCRMISSQYGREFENAEYGKLKKIYSIWICAAPPKHLQNRIIGYSLQPYEIVGNKNDGNNDQDMMRFITVYLGEEDGDKNGLLRLLEVLLDTNKNYTEKKRILHEEYNIEMTSKFNEEVMEMCNLSDGVWNKGVEHGIAEGEARGIAKGKFEGLLEAVRSLMANMGTSAEKALTMIGIPQSEWNIYLPKLT